MAIEKVDGSIWLKKRKMVIRDTDLNDLVSELANTYPEKGTVSARILKINGRRATKKPVLPKAVTPATK